jgi:hypothetical protein
MHLAEIQQQLEEAREKLRAEGRREGERWFFLKQLRPRFGELPPAIVARVEAAEPDVLEVWGERLLLARSLDEVIWDPRARTKTTTELSKIPERPDVRKLRLLLEGQGRIEGELEGKRRALFTLLDARRLAVSPEERSVIEACTDPIQLDQWVRRAATARSTHAVLAANPDVAPPSPPRRARRPKAARSR